MRIGCDLVSIKRIERLFNKQAFWDKFLSKNEQEYIKNPASLAGFWAAKEAASKALGVGISKECSFFDMQIYKDTKNAPRLEFSTRIKEKFHIQSTSLSISHDSGFAMAVILIKC
ncbi:holo-ACP synthase [Campylobacter sp. MIT 12-8780]|uniref:holo-ACP synthase n=1 Tax=unclassified Campylobacter TaxID=2593542 RepID=UPI00115D58A8|nr:MULTISPECIES: holo-ACP synthase [unclassified Campylobacter]NDJ27612.1 holo-ACP synthase [Campylobacter sp. MIT 19-121]TQR40783.1 holo-ACP synthase [Campylobacter sp. MIT 12-8780]